ncbi:MAG: phosphoribosyltransferase [Acidobacteria bacterium]|nr:phosphoribosyltransferase [Acidobacteriota bacterium]MBV9071297.1 phosphoribosyltransferase [Acidobacteriota bacterium]MBV9187555.1 phosphoribosyltransferase [Acidobacteriota bacterium]
MEAGQLLGREIAARLGVIDGAIDDAIVLALPRGGVPVGAEVAKTLGVPLDAFIVRKLGVPGHEELAMGAIASGGVRVLNRDVLDYARVTQQQLDAVAAREERELARREAEYRGNRAPLDVRGRTVIIVDDGLATGSTMRAAVQALRAMEPKRIIVAVPVGASQTCEDLREIADEIVCLRTPEPFEAVGLWYDDFTQTTDAEVHALLSKNPR